jgi:hypothetical protein
MALQAHGKHKILTMLMTISWQLTGGARRFQSQMQFPTAGLVPSGFNSKAKVSLVDLLLSDQVGPRHSAIRMQEKRKRMADTEVESWEDYLKGRGAEEMEAIEKEYLKFKSNAIDIGDNEFDGGDSGSGAVGDGNVDLEDQHNNPTLGALRGGIADYTEASIDIGAGQVMGYRDLPDESMKVDGATNAKLASSGENYWGRSTGMAEKLIAKITEDDIFHHRMDAVRAQQKENWFNQRAIYEANKARGQGVVHGYEERAQPSGGYKSQDFMNSDVFKRGFVEGEVTTKELDMHLKDMMSEAAPRLDGEDWGDMTAEGGEVKEAVHLTSRLSSHTTHNIPVKNVNNVYAPYRCYFTPDSDESFTVSPNAGTMNRQNGDPIDVLIRYEPTKQASTDEPIKGTLVFETEDFKSVWEISGST